MFRGRGTSLFDPQKSDSLTDLVFVTLGLRESGCKFALYPPTVGWKTQICTLIHANLESQIPSLFLNHHCMTMEGRAPSDHH